MPERVATYRWQLTPASGFSAAAAALPDLRRLGVSHLYLSPIAEAVAGSTHGYDVTDPTRIRAELGGDRGFRSLVDACRAHGLQVVIDVVPNHLAAHPSNPYWWDVLRLGQGSRWADLFDIDWTPPKASLRDIVLLPVLGDHVGRELDARTIRLERGAEPGRVLVIRYHDHAFPVRPASTGEILQDAARRCGDTGLGAAARRIGRAEDGTGGDRVERDAETRRAEQTVLAQLGSGVAAAALDGVLAERNADPDRLGDLLDDQHHRLARWRVASSEIDYRRFFDVDTLVAVRSHTDLAFELLLGLPIGLARAGMVDGLRLDHVDGLQNPGALLRRLRSALPDETWLLVEKILRRGEALPGDWPVDGTTGYEVADLLGGWLTDPAGAAALVDSWREVSGETRSYEEVRLEARREVLTSSLVADLERVVDGLARVGEGRRRDHDHPRVWLRAAVIEVAVHLPVYRTYLAPGPPADPERAGADRALVEAAATAGRRTRPDLEPDVFDFVVAVLTGRLDGPAEAEVVARFQQLTGPIAAKGEEDTALYRYVPLLHRCEVGAEPSRPTVDSGEWHAASRAAIERHPSRMTTISTHDTKRSADARARLAVLTTVPDRTVDAFRGWDAAVREQSLAPAHRWLMFHTLVATWPATAERAIVIVEKSLRESGVFTEWRDPDARYEAAARRVVERSVHDPALAAHVERLVAGVAEAGEAAALAQVLLQLLAPGVPDLYQGAESWDLSGVDPDNRRPVDPGVRARTLDAAEQLTVAGAWADRTVRADGTVRAALVRAVLGAAARHRPLRAYQPLPVAGADQARALAFARGTDEGQVSIVVLAARPGPGARVRADVQLDLPPGRWVDLLAGSTETGELSLVDRALPLALLERER